MRIANNIAFVFIGALFLLGAAISVNAQSDSSYLTNPGAIRDTDINVDLIPAVPGPNQNVKITLSSYATDVNKATITWSFNGKQSLSGIGKTTFSFTTGDIGTSTEVGVVMIVAEGSRIDKKITIQPSQVDLLWEAVDSYVPVFYKGKTLPIKESKMKITALPINKDGSVTPATKVYNWKKNFVVDQPSSGYGKYAFSIRNAYVDPNDSVSVTVSDADGSGSTGSLAINYVNPQILVYEKNPSLGLRLNKLLNNGFLLNKGEMTVSAEPFYFSKYKNTINEKNMTYSWIVNGTKVNPPGKLNEITLRGSEQPGTAFISVSITNTNTLFQEAKQSLSVTLGK